MRQQFFQCEFAFTFDDHVCAGFEIVFSVVGRLGPAKHDDQPELLAVGRHRQHSFCLFTEELR